MGQSAYSEELQVLTVPATPTELTATAVSAAAVTLTWIPGATGQYGFRIERSTDENDEFTEIATAWEPEFVIDNLAPNTPYTFRIRAYNAAGQSEYTSTIEVTTDAATAVPTAPTWLYASAVADAAAISLEWTDNSDNEAGFVIQQSTDGTNFTDVATTDPNCTTWTVANLLSDKQYSFRVRATNHMGDSADSNTAAATTASVASAPYVKQAASAADSLVTGTSTTLSVFGVNTASGADVSAHQNHS